LVQEIFVLLAHHHCQLGQPGQYCRWCPINGKTLLTFHSECSHLMCRLVTRECGHCPAFSLLFSILQTSNKLLRWNMQPYSQTSCWWQWICTHQTKVPNITTAHFPLYSHPAWESCILSTIQQCCKGDLSWGTHSS
jgi:hypothetical protein